ncbi:hypothetical protein D3C84_319610 [compost metagenome]
MQPLAGELSLGQPGALSAPSSASRRLKPRTGSPADVPMGWLPPLGNQALRLATGDLRVNSALNRNRQLTDERRTVKHKSSNIVNFPANLVSPRHPIRERKGEKRLAVETVVQALLVTFDGAGRAIARSDSPQRSNSRRLARRVSEASKPRRETHAKAAGALHKAKLRGQGPSHQEPARWQPCRRLQDSCAG